MPLARPQRASPTPASGSYSWSCSRAPALRLRAGGRGLAAGAGVSLPLRQLQPASGPAAPFVGLDNYRRLVERPDGAQLGDQHLRLHLRRGDDRIRPRPRRRAAVVARRLFQRVCLALLLIPVTVTPLVVGLVFRALLVPTTACSATLGRSPASPVRAACSAIRSARSPTLVASTPGNGRRSWR